MRRLLELLLLLHRTLLDERVDLALGKAWPRGMVQPVPGENANRLPEVVAVAFVRDAHNATRQSERNAQVRGGRNQAGDPERLRGLFVVCCFAFVFLFVLRPKLLVSFASLLCVLGTVIVIGRDHYGSSRRNRGFETRRQQ
jgi:Flp pilus assembly protein TadB